MVRKAKLQPQNDGYTTVHTVRIPLWPYMVAPLFCLATLPLAWGAHRAYGRDAASAGWMGVALTLFGIGLIVFTFAASRPRGGLMNIMATLNAGLAMLWIVPAVIEGPLTAGMVGIWLVGSLWISATSAIYRVMRQARGDDGHGQILNGEFGELGDAVKQLKGVTFRRPVIEGAKVKSGVEMPPGRSFEDVAAAKKEIASLLDVRANAVRTPASSDSERRGEVHVVPVDQLKDPVPDPGIEPGLSMADPMVLGVTEEGTAAEIILPGDPSTHRNAVGVMCVVGMSGSGKTELLLRFAKCVVTRRDGDLNVIDCRKAGQLPPWLKRSAKQVVDGHDAALEWMEDLEGRVARRAEWLGSRGYKQWVPGCGLQFETYVIFEAAAIIRESNIVDLAESVRSVGMCIVLELQRATWDRLPTSARSNITTWICLGVQKEDDAQAALSEETIEAGAAPWKWGNGRPGYFYLEWAGRPQEAWSAPCRSFIQSDADRERDVANVLGLWAPEEPEADRQAVVPAPRGGQDDDRGEDTVEPGVDPDDPPDDVDPAQPIEMPAGMPRLAFGDSRRKMPTEQALGLLRSYVWDLVNARIEYVKPTDFADVLAQTGLSSSWLRSALDTLEGEGVLRKTQRGTWRVVQPDRVGSGAEAG